MIKKLSVIIPSYNDGKNVRKLVNQLVRMSVLNLEIIVVESGKSEYKKYLPKGVVFLKSDKGRALQMNIGAEKSRGEILIFLHADSDVSEINFSKIRETFREGRFGCFKIKFKNEKRYFRFIEFTSNFRKRFLGIPFGDQGLIVSKKLFDKVGGFSKGGFEDIDMARGLMKFAKVEIINQTIKTSPRRFLKRGIVKTHLVMGLIFLSYFFGLKKLAYGFYGAIR